VGPARQREKRKRKGERQAWAAAGRGKAGCWATGPKGKRGKFLSFFSFSFSNYFQINLLNSNSNQTFLNFSQNFYNLFRIHTSNQKPCKAK
jgi:hypothetical protein